MKPEEYQLFYCPRCGWGICAFAESDLVKKYHAQGQYPLCPYCRVRGTGVFCGSTNDFISDWKIKESVNLRPNIPKSVRKLVMERDKYTCQICGDTTRLHIDHIIPAIDGGGILPDNLQVLCATCNISKSSGVTVSEGRKMALVVRDTFKNVNGTGKILTMKEISRVAGLKYRKVCQYQFQIHKELQVLGLRLRGYPE